MPNHGNISAAREWNQENSRGPIQDQIANSKDRNEDNPTHDSISFITHVPPLIVKGRAGKQITTFPLI
jgi:hypothetical protein